MTSGQHSHSVVDRIPTELLLALGQFLDGSSLVDCLQVCRQWHHTLQPLVWSTISEHQWHSKSFPIQPDVNSSRDIALLPHLSLIRQISWAENNIIATKKKGPKIVVGRQLSATRLAWLLQRTPNLAILSLKRYCDGFAPVLYPALADLPNLRRLHIHVFFHKTQIPIENMFSLFSRLDDLHLGGSWYIHEKSTEPLLPSKKATTPWRLRSLKCTRLDLALTRYCPDLTFFEMYSYEHRIGIPPVSLRFRDPIKVFVFGMQTPIPHASTHDALDTEPVTFASVSSAFKAINDYYDEIKRNQRILQLEKKRYTHEHSFLRPHDGDQPLSSA